MKTGRYNLSQLLASPEVGQIIIPELQRDYVWEKRNVQGLMNSILSRYQEKTTVTLKIEEEKKNVPNSIKQYLERQYSRLRYNVRIGFIYAYHSVDELDKYYLIDGQQRITTLFLSLLVAYKKAQRANDFRRLYFVNNLPKLDYKVRDISHQFLVSLIDYELSPQSKSFDQSKFFHQAYSHDKSAATLWNNYQLITSILKNEKDYNSLIDYLENYIEFNYFDTNMSYQGERLYLYMNSRGETLSSHEIIKAVMVERSDDKLKAGTLWEDWQDFFWRNRDCNRNADKGFAEFIKWSVILHMNCHEKEKKSDTHKLKEPINKSSNISQSVQEVKEDYIKIFFDSEDDLRQQKWIKQYILDNPSFDISWMAEHMKALKKLSIQTKLAFPPHWLSKVNNVIDYALILGCLQYETYFPKASTDHFYRFWLWVKGLCCSYYNRRNPDATTIRVLELTNWMQENQTVNVGNLQSFKCNQNANVYRQNDLRFSYISDQNHDADTWVDFFSRITLNHELCTFLRGNYDFIIRLFNNNSNIQNAKHYLALFIFKIFRHCKNDYLRKDLLEHGDISVYDGGGSSHLAPYQWMERWNLLVNDRDENAWDAFLNYKNSNGIYDPLPLQIVKDYLDNKSVLQVAPLLQGLRECLGYMSQKKYLWYKNDNEIERCVLLSKHQAGEDKTRELPIAVLHTHLRDSWCWGINYCVINFKYDSGQLVRLATGSGYDTNRNQGYYIDIWYDYDSKGGSWSCRLGNKQKDLHPSLVQELNTQIPGFKQINRDRVTMELLCFDKETTKDNFLDSEKRVEIWFNNFWLQKLPSIFSNVAAKDAKAIQ